jgi:hypothetical protein
MENTKTTTTTTTLSPSASVSAPSSSESMFTIGGGQAGLLYALSDDIIRMLNKLQSIARELANAQTEAEKLTIRIGADATRNAAYEQSLATWMQAGSALLSGVASVATTAAAPLVTKGLTEKVAKIDEKAEPLKALKESALKPTLSPAELTAIQDNGIGKQELETRIAELKNGNYVQDGYLNNPDLDNAAIQSMKLDKNPESYMKFRGKLDKAIEAKSKESSSLSSTISEKKQDLNLYRDIVTNGGAAVSKGAESQFGANQGKESAANQTAAAIERMADSSANAARGNLNQDFSKVSEAISAARQGAQAYAQG